MRSLTGVTLRQRERPMRGNQPLRRSNRVNHVAVRFLGIIDDRERPSSCRCDSSMGEVRIASNDTQNCGAVAAFAHPRIDASTAFGTEFPATKRLQVRNLCECRSTCRRVRQPFARLRYCVH